MQLPSPSISVLIPVRDEADAIRPLINADTDLTALRRAAFKDGMRSLRLSGAQKVAAGLTTIEEVLRVTPQSEQK